MTFRIITAVVVLLFSCGGERRTTENYYYPDGALMYEVTYVDGVIDGSKVDYYSNGTVKCKAMYKEGKLDGSSIFYYRDGSLQNESEYLDGKCMVSRDYSQNGNIMETRTYDSLGRLWDYMRYEPDGARDFSFGNKNPIFIPEKDTINLGEAYRSYIRLGNRQFNHVDVVIGDVTDPLILKKNEKLPKLDSVTSILVLNSEKEGLNEVTGVVFEYKITSDSFDVVPFVHRFFVRPLTR